MVEAVAVPTPAPANALEGGNAVDEDGAALATASAVITAALVVGKADDRSGTIIGILVSMMPPRKRSELPDEEVRPGGGGGGRASGVGGGSGSGRDARCNECDANCFCAA